MPKSSNRLEAFRIRYKTKNIRAHRICFNEQIAVFKRFGTQKRKSILNALYLTQFDLVRKNWVACGMIFNDADAVFYLFLAAMILTIIQFDTFVAGA